MGGLYRASGDSKVTAVRVRHPHTGTTLRASYEPTTTRLAEKLFAGEHVQSGSRQTSTAAFRQSNTLTVFRQPATFGLHGPVSPRYLRRLLSRTTRRVIGINCVVRGFSLGQPGQRRSSHAGVALPATERQSRSDLEAASRGDSRSRSGSVAYSPEQASGRGAKDCCFRMSRCLPTCRVWLARLLAVGDRQRRSCSPEIRAMQVPQRRLSDARADTKRGLSSSADVPRLSAALFRISALRPAPLWATTGSK
jgi:hypothetical protein